MMNGNELEFWTRIKPDLRRALHLAPSSLEEAQCEYDQAGANPLEDNERDSIIRDVTSRGAEPLIGRALSHELPQRDLVWRAFLIAGVAAAALFALTWIAWTMRPSYTPPATEGVVAVITEEFDAKWLDRDLQVSEVDSAKQLQLTSGIATLQTKDGARIVVYAPATFTLPNASRMILSRGKVLVNLPNSARGFTVNTPGMNVVDLGTQFGVDASPGVEEVHVLKGTVAVLDGSGAQLALRTGQALAFTPGVGTRMIAANPALFPTPIANVDGSQIGEQ